MEMHVSECGTLHRRHAVSIGNARIGLLIPTGPACKLLSGQADNPDDRWQQRGGRWANQLLCITAEHIRQETEMSLKEREQSTMGGCKGGNIGNKK